jgi:hypothetical protein
MRWCVQAYKEEQGLRPQAPQISREFCAFELFILEYNVFEQKRAG